MAELSTLGSVIKAAYEGEANTNAFTDAEQSKLSGVEAGATNNAGALADLNTVGTSQIDNDAVTYAKMQNASGAGLLGATGAGDHALLTAAQGRSFLGQYLHKTDATAAPTVNDDTGDGYAPGSYWVDLTADAVYFCSDASAGAAVWHLINEIATADLLSPTDDTAGYFMSADAVPAADKYLRTNATFAAEDGISEDGVEIGAIGFHLYNGGAALTTSIIMSTPVEFSGTVVAIRGIITTSDNSTSSITVSFHKDTLANYAQATLTEISSTEDFIITTAHQAAKTSGFGSWTGSGAITRGDVLQAKVASVDADVVDCKIIVEVRKS